MGELTNSFLSVYRNSDRIPDGTPQILGKKENRVAALWENTTITARLSDVATHNNGLSAYYQP